LRASGALRLALLAVFGVVFELFVVKEELLAGRENELGAAIYTFQDSIGEFHGQLASQGITPTSVSARSRAAGLGSLFTFLWLHKGPGPH
jgi:hypothetical protein